MNIPKLDENKYSILIAEYATGIVYKTNLTFYREGENENDVFQIFNNFTEARNHALKFVAENPKFECTIYDYRGEFISIFNLEGERTK